MVNREDIDHDAPLAEAARVNGLKPIASLVYMGAVANMLTTVMGSIVAAPRIILAMAQDGLLPEFLGRTPGEVPRAALGLTILPAVVIAGCFDFQEMADIVGGGALCTFSAVCASLLIVRFQETALEQAYDDVPLFPRADTPTGAPGPVVLGAASADAGTSSPDTPPKSLVSSDSEVPAVPRRGCHLCDINRLADIPPFHELYDFLSHVLSCGLQQILSKGQGYSLPVRLAAFTVLSAALSPSARLSSENGSTWPWLHLIPLAVTIALITLVVSMTIAFRPYRAFAAKRKQEPGERTEFRMRMLPLLPLFGIFMNMLLFSQLPLVSMRRMLYQFIFCGAQYFLYGVQHSHLRAGMEVKIVKCHFNDLSGLTRMSSDPGTWIRFG
eukprot:2401522-Amphidinium_carterae.1